jgi:alkylation response protein AidB-like acyl-CoA dehydrogenase
MLRGLVREFLNRESAPRAVRSVMAEPLGFSQATWQQVSEMGLPGLAIDAGYGGQGLGMVELALVLEEMGRVAYPSPFFATVVLAASAIAAGSESQKARYLPDLAQGRTKATLALVDDALSWAPAGVTTTAGRTADGYVLSGTKRFVPFAHAADLVLVVARTSASLTDGTTVFVVAGDAPGLQQTPNVEMDQTSRTSTLILNDVVVPAEAIIGEVDRGW